MRGLSFLADYAPDGRCWAQSAPDVVYMFFHFATRARDERFAKSARTLARRSAARWLGENPRVPPAADPVEVLWWYAYGVYTADRLGLDTGALRADLAGHAGRIRPRAIFGFDPRRQVPPSRRAWQEAMVGAHIAEGVRLPFACSVRDAIRWRATMLPYPRPRRSLSWPGWCAFYAVTHLIYVLNDYSLYALSGSRLAPEVEFVRSACSIGLEQGDVEAIGESLDVLLALGTSEDDLLVARARAALLDMQRRDGSWAARWDDAYARFHKTWVALDGLTSYGRREVRRPRIPEPPS